MVTRPVIKNCLIVTLLCSTMQLFVYAGAFCADPLLSLDIEDLSQVKVGESYATLTSINPREVPASITVITSDDIERSGARNLDELLDIYVPGFQYMYKTHGSQAGIRGIISDRNNKLLLTVNGRSMNIKASDGGAVTERWFSMLGDIRRITIVCGPGSAVYGPGAIAGIINIETWTGRDFQGLDLSVRAGAVENFGSLEARYGTRFPDGTGFFAYYGLDYYPGADQDYAPLKFAYDFENPAQHIDYSANSEAGFSVPNDNGSFRNLVRHKFHAQIDGENYELWLRYTLSGQRIPAPQQSFTLSYIDPDKCLENGAGNQQLTLFGRYTHDFTSWLSVDYVLSYLVSDVQINYTYPGILGNRNWSEDDIQSRVMAHLTPRDGHRIALGAEYYYDNFGRKGFLKRDKPSSIYGLPKGSQWYSYMFSLVGEYQAQLTYNIKAIAGIRADRHRRTSWMFSPRAALVYSHGAADTFKLIYNRSVRHADEADLYRRYLDGSSRGDIETLDNFEFIYERKQSSALDLHLSTFYNRHHVVAFDTTTLRSDYVGMVQTYGIEASLNFHTERARFKLSHSFTKLINFKIVNGVIDQNISAEPYGYGNDLANWINNATKFVFDYDFTDRLSLNSSLRCYWGLPGGKDLADYNMDEIGSYRLPMYDGSGGHAFGKSFFLDIGLKYRLSEDTQLLFHGYNLLGIFDRDINKRNFFQRTSMYRDSAPSCAIRISRSF